MLYTEDFTMHHYVGFSQIGSHITVYRRYLLPVVYLEGDRLNDILNVTE